MGVYIPGFHFLPMCLYAGPLLVEMDCIVDCGGKEEKKMDGVNRIHSVELLFILLQLHRVIIEVKYYIPLLVLCCYRSGPPPSTFVSPSQRTQYEVHLPTLCVLPAIYNSHLHLVVCLY